MLQFTLSLLGLSQEQCGRPCTCMDVRFSYPYIYNATLDYTMVEINFKTTVTVRENHLEYDIGNLFSEIGGYTGLLLGVSVLDLSKVLMYFLQKIRAQTPN